MSQIGHSLIMKYSTQTFYTFDSEFSYLEAWFTNENFKILQIEIKQRLL